MILGWSLWLKRSTLYYSTTATSSPFPCARSFPDQWGFSYSKQGKQTKTKKRKSDVKLDYKKSRHVIVIVEIIGNKCPNQKCNLSTSLLSRNIN